MPGMPRALQLAVVGTAAGAFQAAYGNVDVAKGALCFAGFPVASAVALANALPERAPEVSFAMLQLFVASQLVRRAVREERSA
jgi:hypothetical protein